MNSELHSISMSYEPQSYFLPGIIYEDMPMTVADDTSSCFYPSLPLPQLFSSIEDFHHNNSHTMSSMAPELSPELNMVNSCFMHRERFSSQDSLPAYVPRERFASHESINWTPSILPSNNTTDPILPLSLPQANPTSSSSCSSLNHNQHHHLPTQHPDFMWTSQPKPNVSSLSKRARSFQCTICLKNFDRKFVLKRHMGTHRVDKDYSCKPCNMGFYRKDIFDRHIATKKCIKAHRAYYGPAYQPPQPTLPSSSSPGAPIKFE